MVLIPIRFPPIVHDFPRQTTLMGGQHFLYDRVRNPLIAIVDRQPQPIARPIGQPLMNGEAVEKEHIPKFEGTRHPFTANLFIPQALQPFPLSDKLDNQLDDDVRPLPIGLQYLATNPVCVHAHMLRTIRQKPVGQTGLSQPHLSCYRNTGIGPSTDPRNRACYY